MEIAEKGDQIQKGLLPDSLGYQELPSNPIGKIPSLQLISIKSNFTQLPAESIS